MSTIQNGKKNILNLHSRRCTDLYLQFQLSGPVRSKPYDKHRYFLEVITLSIFLCFSVVSCPALTRPTNGEEIVLTENNNYNSTATFICSTGFHLNGSSSLTCNGDSSSATGSWSRSEPTCQSKS
jgi:hypothetical protein